MSFVPGDWSIDRQTRNIRYIGNDHTGASPSYASVIEFHRALQDFADQEGYSGNDELDITDPTPSDRSTDNIVTLINGWNIDDGASEHVYDGSIIQTGGAEIYDGIKILAPTGTVVQFLQNPTMPGAVVLADDWWNNGVAASGADDSGGTDNAFLTDSGESWTTDQWKGYRIYNTTDGSFADITGNTATTITGALQGGTDNNWDSGDAYYIGKGLNDDVDNGVSHNFMLKVRTGSNDIDGRRLIATTRQWGRTYLEFKVNGTTRGINVVALAAATDLNNASSTTTVAGYSDVANQNEGYIGIDVDNDTANEFYYSRWTKASRTINQFYERMKYVSRDGSSSTLYGLNGEVFRGITHEVDLSGGTGGPWSAFETVSWGTGATAGTGQMLAINNTTPTSATKMWIQLLNGVKPADTLTITGGTSGATNTVNTTVTDRTISTPFVGVSTGSAIIGAYGFGVLAADLTQNDKVFDLTNTQYSPPNIVTFTVSGLVNSPNDRVLVGPKGYRFAYDGEDATGSAFAPGDTLTFTVEGSTATLAEIYDNGTTGFIYTGEISGTLPADNSAFTNGSGRGATINGAVSSDINLRQLTVSGPVSGASVGTITVNEAIPTDTPNTSNSGSKTIRIERADGQYTRHPYDSWSGSVFTLSSPTDFSTNNVANGANLFISYIDQPITSGTSTTFSGVYSADRNLFIRVRSGSGAPGTLIKTAETTGTLSSSGGSSNTTRTSDE